MSLRLRLIGLIAGALALSLALGAGIACLNASRSVETEMRSAAMVARQVIETGIARLGTAENPQADLEALVASFRGNRHLRVYLTSDSAAMAAPTREMPAFGKVPGWFARLVGVAPTTTRIAVSIHGSDAGAVVVETDPRNEILEIWNSFADSALMLMLFFGPTMLLVWLFLRRALRPLDRLAVALGGIGQGDYRIRLGGSLPRELSPLRDSFNRMAGQLSEATAENRRLNEQLLTLQEQERGDLARDLHDEIGPFLFAINIGASNIGRHVDEGRLVPVRGHVQSIVEAVGHMQRQVRSMLGRLRPIGLAEFGLAEALAGLVEFWRRRNPEIAYRLDIAADAEGFGELLDPTIYRIVQECLSNAMRHGRPTAVNVALDRREVGRDGEEELVIVVADDGQGMAEPPGLGYGLRGMSERVKALGGDLTISSPPGQGLTVTATLPCIGAGVRDAAERVLAS